MVLRYTRHILTKFGQIFGLCTGGRWVVKILLATHEFERKLCDHICSKLSPKMKILFCIVHILGFPEAESYQSEEKRKANNNKILKKVSKP